MRRSIAARNAARVLPEPVGASTSTLSPSAIAGQASSCARVGAWNVASNHARVAGLNIAGKTGTVQVIAQSGWFSTANMPYMSRDHAWFASYAPNDNPQMVVVVFVEHAGAHGGTDSAPLAKLLYESRFQQQIGNASLDLTNPDTLERIREGRIPLPGQVTKAPPQPATSNLGH